MEILICLEQKHRFRCETILFSVLVLALFCHGFVIDLGIESEKINSTSSAFKRFSLEFNDGIGSPSQNREKVIEYLSRDIVRERLVVMWAKMKDAGFRRQTYNGRKQITEEWFAITNKLTVKTVLYYLQFFPLLYKDESGPIDFHIPLDGHKIVITLQNDCCGSFTAVHRLRNPPITTDISNIDVISSVLDKVACAIRTGKTDLSSLLQIVFNSQLDDEGNYETAFPSNHRNPLIKRAFLIGIEFLLSTSILRKQLRSSAPVWLRYLNTALEIERKALEYALADLIKDQPKTQLRYELTANMVQTSDYYRGKWQELVDAKVVRLQLKSSSSAFTTVTINANNKLLLKDVFKLLQYYLSFGFGFGITRFNIPIGGEMRTFYLSRSLFGVDQILVQTHDSDWTNTYIGNPKFVTPDYNKMMNLLEKVTDQSKLAAMMVLASESTLSNQPSFEAAVRNSASSRMTLTEKATIVRTMVEFMLVTMVSEAAAPSDTIKYLFNKKLAYSIKKIRAFPGKSQMPELGDLGEKSGRSPTEDDLVLGMLDEMAIKNINIGKQFNDANFPLRMLWGIQKEREYLYDNGDMLIPSYLIKNSANGILIKARKSCTRS